ncbi:S-adenosyl-L-methionine-dependent methyltransferase [Gongronella butleri]|nr:S-adenosyl-L-methionine-dependent methyltransferase [Gongronella butleri]
MGKSPPRRSTFLQVFQAADDRAHDAVQDEMFPAYIDSVDATLAPFCPTSAARVVKALQLAHVSDTDTLIDLGSGDGRFVTAAVAEFGCKRAYGVETDELLVEDSRRLADEVLGCDHRTCGVEFEQGDLLETLKTATCARDLLYTVIVVFLLPDHTDRFADDLVALYRRGARIVSLVFNLSEIPELQLQHADDSDGIFIYASSPLS